MLRLLLLFTLLPTLLQAITLDISKLGAKGDGLTLNTKIIQNALDLATARGGTVVVPSGKYLTGTLFIKSNTTLRLEAGAILLGSQNLKDYTAVRWGHHEDRTPWHLIVASGDNITLTGEGTIDGQGPAFWEPGRANEWAFFKEREQRPSPMIEMDNCHNVRVEGLTLQNSAGWTLHFLDCKRAQALNLRIYNTLFGPNTDGIDITGGEDIVISNCIIETGDDAIALKTTEDSGPLTFVTISNCVLQSSCVALRVGFESRKDFRHITVSNIVVKSASRIIDLRTVEGANIEDVLFTNISGTTNSGWPINRVIEVDADAISNAYKIDIKEHPNYGKDKPVTKPGYIRNIRFDGLNIETDGRIMMGTKTSLIENVTMRDIHLKYALIDPPNPISAKPSSLGYFQAQPELRQAYAAFCFNNVRNVDLSGLTVEWPNYPVSPDWKLLKSNNRSFNGDYYTGKENAVTRGEGAPDFSVLWASQVQGGRIDIRGAQSSSAKAPRVVNQNSTFTLVE